MQEGEALYRALSLKMSSRVSLAVIVIAALTAFEAAGMEIRGNPIRPEAYLDPFAPLVKGGYLLCCGSRREPYGIEDLSAYRAQLGVRSERFALWAIWDAVTQTLYRLDELKLRIGAGRCVLPLSIFIEPMLRREVVKGCPAERSACVAAAVVFQHAGLACSLRSVLHGGTGRENLQVACSARLDPLSIALSGCGTERGYFLDGVEGQLSIGEPVSLGAAYRLDTCEISFGVSCRRSGLLLTAFWSHHPVLGRTTCLGVGYLWRR